MFAASLSPIMGAASGRLHNGGRAAFGHPPTVVDSIMGAGEAANIAKTYANVYQIFTYFSISYIFLYSHYVDSGAIHLAKSPAPYGF